MKETRLRRALTILGKAPWWRVAWWMITHPREFWTGFIDGVRNG